VRIIEGFASRYTNPKIALQYRAELAALFSNAWVVHPRALTEAAVNQSVGHARANNTRRNRLAPGRPRCCERYL
jgi:hypothetical protein